MNKVDPRKVASIAFIIFALVSWMRSEFTTQVGYWTLILPQLVQGGAMACFFIPLVSITLSQVNPNNIPSASGVSSFVRITCGALGASIFTTLWESRASLHHAQLTESISALRPEAAITLGQLQSSGLTDAQSLGLMDRLITQQAFTLSADELFLASAVIFLALTAIVWFAKPVKVAAAVVGGDH
jgi:DHA2 family multidrug resistance protein